jgi:hypothetical protein
MGTRWHRSSNVPRDQHRQENRTSQYGLPPASCITGSDLEPRFSRRGRPAAHIPPTFAIARPRPGNSPCVTPGGMSRRQAARLEIRLETPRDPKRCGEPNVAWIRLKQGQRPLLPSEPPPGVIWLRRYYWRFSLVSVEMTFTRR